MKKKDRSVSFILNWILFAFFFFVLFVNSYAQAVEPQALSKSKKEEIYEIEAQGYKYKYEAVPFEAETIFYRGKVTIRGPDNTVRHEEIMPFQPGMCNGFPPISKLPVKSSAVYEMLMVDPKKEMSLAILCGSISGRHQTMKIFLNTPVSLKSTSLHFGDTKPNLSDVDGDGFYEAKVYRRVLLDYAGYSLVSYLSIYKLYIDDNMFGFIPTFGQKIANMYFDYYLWLKNSSTRENFNDRVGPILAALLSTQNRDKICAGIEVLRANGITIKELEAWKERLRGLGYPDFDLSICKEGLK